MLYLKVHPSVGCFTMKFCVPAVNEHHIACLVVGLLKFPLTACLFAVMNNKDGI